MYKIPQQLERSKIATSKATVYYQYSMLCSANFAEVMCPDEAWDTETESLVDLISRFNFMLRQFRVETQFRNPPSIAEFQLFLKNVVDLMRQEKHQTASELIEMFIPILVQLDIASQLFSVALVCFRQAHSKFPKCDSFLRILAVCYILYSDLPIKYSLDHVMNIGLSESRIIVDVFGDESASVEAKCLSVFISVPSTRFTESKFETVSSSSYLPDPILMVQNHSLFGSDELRYACFVMQHVNSVVREVGDNETIVNLKQLICIQNVIVDSHLSLACLCQSIYAHSEIRSALPYALNFWKSLDCECGAEIIKEMMLMNTSVSYCMTMKRFGSMISRMLETRDLAENFKPIVSAIGMSLKQAISTITDATSYTNEVHLTWAFTILMRMSFESISNIGHSIIERFHSIQHHFINLIERIVLNPQLHSPVFNDIGISTLALFYKLFNSLKISHLSMEFVRDTVSLLNFLVFVPVIPGSYIFLGVKRLYETVSETVMSHRTQFMKFVKDISSTGNAVGNALVLLFCPFDGAILAKILPILLETHLHQIFHVAKRLCLTMCSSAQFVDLWNSFFFDIFMDDRIHEELRLHKFFNYILVTRELISHSESFANAFIETFAFENINIMTDSLLKDTKSVYKQQYMEIIVYFYDIVYSKCRIVPPVMNLTPVFLFVRHQFSINALLNLSLTILGAHPELQAFPYQIPSQVNSLNCEMLRPFCEFLKSRFEMDIAVPDEPVADVHPEREIIPWIVNAPYNEIIVDKSLSLICKPTPVSRDNVITDR